MTPPSDRMTPDTVAKSIIIWLCEEIKPQRVPGRIQIQLKHKIETALANIKAERDAKFEAYAESNPAKKTDLEALKSELSTSNEANLHKEFTFDEIMEHATKTFTPDSYDHNDMIAAFCNGAEWMLQHMRRVG